jgi:hypothetical protein
MHLIFVAGQLIGYFHQPSVIVVGAMVVLGVVLIGVFMKVFEHDFLDFE